MRPAVGWRFLLMISLLLGDPQHSQVLASSEAQQLHAGLDWSVHIVCHDCISLSSSSYSLHLAVIINATVHWRHFLSVKYFHDSGARILFVVFHFTFEKKLNYK